MLFFLLPFLFFLFQPLSSTFISKAWKSFPLSEEKKQNTEPLWAGGGGAVRDKKNVINPMAMSN